MEPTVAVEAGDDEEEQQKAAAARQWAQDQRRTVQRLVFDCFSCRTDQKFAVKCL